MTNYGKIASYDGDKGTGTITPEKGDGPLMFAKTDLKQSSQAPSVDQRFGYDTRHVEGKARAVNLQLSPAGNDADKPKS